MSIDANAPVGDSDEPIVYTPETREDREDLKAARVTATTSKRKRWYQSIGPGLITGAADDDPSGIGTYSQAGASFGYGQLWLIPLTLPMMIAIQEMCGRLGAVTGKGLAAVIKCCFPKWLLYSCVLLLLVANTLNVYADLNVMAASARMLFGLPQALWLTLISALLIGLQIAIPYKNYARLLKYLCITLAGYIIVALLPSVHNDWPSITRHLLMPNWSSKLDYQIAAVAFLGTTISPYLFFWQAGETVEEVVADGNADAPGERTKRVRENELRNIRADTTIGMLASQTVAFFIMVAVAGTLFRTGKTDINTAQDAALALKPLGHAAYWIFAFCMLGAGMLAVPTLAGSAAYAVSEALDWRYGLYRRFKRAPGFYLTVAAVVLVGLLLNFFSTISPIKALVYSAVVNAIVAVPLMIVLLLACNNPDIVQKRTNGIWSNLFGWATVILMGGASVFFIWTLVTGKAS
jgi:NRAMP (natural resistance-associated macrophage protein)-like metal ion transporter